MGNPRRFAVLIALFAALTLSVVAAFDVSRVRSGIPADERISPRDSDPQPYGVALPFDAYRLSTLDIHTVEAAEDVLVRACMRTRGMDWETLPLPSAADAEPPNARRYGLIDPAAAARYGYHLPPPSTAEARRQAIWAKRGRLPARQRLAAFGKGGTSGGCWGRAHARLLRGVSLDRLSQLDRYAMKTFAAARRTHQVAAATRAWSRCMGRAGFDYADPFAATGDPAWRRSGRPTARELSAARADIRCKDETGLIRIWSRADERVQREAIRAHSAEFEAIGQTRKRWLDAARRTLREERRQAGSVRSSAPAAGSPAVEFRTPRGRHG